MSADAFTQYRDLVIEHERSWPRQTPAERNRACYLFGRLLARMTPDERDAYEVERKTLPGPTTPLLRFSHLTVELDRLWTVLPEGGRIARLGELDRLWFEGLTDQERRSFGTDRRGRP